MNDKVMVRMVVGGLIAVALAVVLGAIFLVAGGHEVPDGLWALGAGAAGAVGAVLSRTNTQPEPPAPVQPVLVANQPDQPVPVDQS